MIRPHSPNETPADEPDHSGGGRGAWSSPWELDQEWADAPPAKRIPIAEKKAENPAPREPKTAPEEKARARATERVEPVVTVAVPPRQVAPPHRSPARAERDGHWGLLAILSMGLLAFVFIAWLYVDDPVQGSDDDLRSSRPVDQAIAVPTPAKVRKFLDSLVPFENAELYRQPPWLWDTPTLSRIVQSNGAALDNLRDLLEDADWHPAHAAWHVEDLGSDARWHQAMRLKQAEAAYLSRRQQEEGAFTAAIDLAELGWRLEQIWAWPSCYQRSLESQTLAAQTLADLLRQTRLPEITLRQFQRQFSLCQPDVEVLHRALSAFYVHEKTIILGPASGEPLDTLPGGVQLSRPGRLLFKPNETLRLFATAFRQLKDEVQAPLAQTSRVLIKDVPSEESLYQPNSAGHVYFHERMKVYTSMPAFLGLTRARGNLIITLFAVRRCIAERKTLPATLEQLRADRFLLDLPPDPYTGAPLQYSLSRGLIWSVGNDLVSKNGASTEPPMSDATEPTVEIGIAVAAVAK